MKPLLFALFLLLTTAALTSCKKNQPETQQTSDPTSQNTAEPTPPETDFNAVLNDVIAAFRKENAKALNRYLDPQTGCYLVMPSMGIYSQFVKFDNADDLLHFDQKADDLETKNIENFLNLLANYSQAEITPQGKDLFGAEPCDFIEKGVFEDTNEAETKILTEIYNINAERDGTPINADELVQLASLQKEATKQVFFGDGEIAYVLYFALKKGKWYLSILDLRNCEA